MPCPPGRSRTPRPQAPGPEPGRPGRHRAPPRTGQVPAPYRVRPRGRTAPVPPNRARRLHRLRRRTPLTLRTRLTSLSGTASRPSRTPRLHARLTPSPPGGGPAPAVQHVGHGELPPAPSPGHRRLRHITARALPAPAGAALHSPHGCPARGAGSGPRAPALRGPVLRCRTLRARASGLPPPAHARDSSAGPDRDRDSHSDTAAGRVRLVLVVRRPVPAGHVRPAGGSAAPRPTPSASPRSAREGGDTGSVPRPGLLRRGFLGPVPHLS